MRRTRVIALLLVIGILVPLGAGVLLSWSLQGRDQSLDNIPVAIVNDDEIVTGDRPMAAGRELSAALVHPEDDTPSLGWTVTDAASAETGLANGDYYAVLTIPEDFSEAVLSVGTATPRTATLTLETSPGGSPTAAFAAQIVTQTAATALGEQVTDAFVTSTLSGISDISEAIDTAADGAASLADSSQTTADAAAQLSSSTAELRDGIQSLESGASSLSSGAASTADGAAALAEGANTASDGANGLVDASTQVSSGTAAVATGTESLSDSLSSLAAACPTAPAMATYCEQVAAAAAASNELASSSNSVAAGASSMASATDTLSTSLSTLATSAAEMSDAAAQVSSGAQASSDAAGQLSNAADQLTDGTAQLADGTTQLASGADELSSGLADGAAKAPTYTAEQAEDVADVASAPISPTSDASSSGAGWVPAVIAGVVLWIGTLTALLVGRRPLRNEAVSSPVSTRRLAHMLLGPRALVAAAQGLVVASVLAVVGFAIEQAILFGVVTMLAATVLVTLLSGLQALFGKAGMIGFAMFTALQLAASAVLLPVQTAPSALGAIDMLLPVNAYVSLAAGLAGSDNGTSAGSAVACLVAWAAIGALMAVAGIRHRRGRRGFSLQRSAQANERMAA